MKPIKYFFTTIMLIAAALAATAQNDAQVNARIDAKQITVGDQARLFLEAKNNPANSRLQWATIPDTFDHLEVVERGKIDTIKQGDAVTYRQRILITGFDSGIFKIPAFVFAVIPNGGTAYTIQSDSFALFVQTVAVDTTKAFKPIKGILAVKSTWMDYIGYIIGSAVLLALIIALVIYLARRKKPELPVIAGPTETIQEYSLRMLSELEAKQLWQKKQIKQYYVELTDVVRSYIELRFQTQVMELTTDELLQKVMMNKEMLPYHQLLSGILHTADLAKFAKAQPLPQEHIEAMEKAREFVATSTPIVITITPDTQTNNDSKAN